MSTGLTGRRAPRGSPYSLSPSRHYLHALMALVPLAGVCSPAGATDGDAPEQIIVSATRTPTPALEVASSITVITAADLEARQLRTISDALKDVPGLNVVQTGGPGGVTSVFIRGTNSNHTKVLIDGIDVSDPSNSTGDFRTVADPRHRAHRGAARTAERALRLGCHRRGHQHHHPIQQPGFGACAGIRMTL